MSKRGYITRYMVIIKRLKSKPFSTFEDVELYVTQQLTNLHMQDDTLVVGFSKRTLQRDIREIRTLFGVNIIYDKGNKGYLITESSYDSTGFNRMIEAFNVFNSLYLTQNVSNYISIESRKPQGTENLYDFLHAIKNKLIVSFDYQKYYESSESNRIVEPYFLKEFKNRWYLLAINKGESQIKTFALDRLSGLEITNFKFNKNYNINVNKIFQDSFGIINGEGEPVKVVLSFDAFQGKYIKSLPLHHSQRIIVDSDSEFRVQLNVYVTHDLLMEIQSFGETVTVLEPASLINDIQHSLTKALNNYAV